jgi:hypothetical protein
MASTVFEGHIRSRAYELWLEAGSPEGRAEDFWEQARLQLTEQEAPTQEDIFADSDEFASASSVKAEAGDKRP